MNTYEKIYFEDFRKKYAYQKGLRLLIKVNELIGTCDTWDKAYVLKETTKVCTEIALAMGSILSDKRKDHHYKVAIVKAYEVLKVIKEEWKFSNVDVEEISKLIEEIIRLTRTYRKNIRLKESTEVKKVNVEGKLDLNKIEEMIDGIKPFRELKAYKIMIEFYKKLFPILSDLPYHEQYSVFSQVQRASESIIANLAEGNARGVLYPKVEVNFYTVAIGSSIEVSAWLDVMLIKGYISNEEHTQLEGMLEQIRKLIITYIKTLVA